jgi:hypothetical protein
MVFALWDDAMVMKYQCSRQRPELDMGPSRKEICRTFESQYLAYHKVTAAENGKVVIFYKFQLKKTYPVSFIQCSAQICML